MSYYSQLAGSTEPARRDGWLRSIGQAYRFELARQVIQERDSVIDLGCGEARLARYLQHEGWGGGYLGVDLRANDVAAGQIIRGDMFEVGIEADVAVCIGGLVDGTPRGEREMRDRASRLVSRMKSAPAGLVIAVDLARLPMWRRDAEMAGVRQCWFDEFDVRVVEISRDEVALVWGAALDCTAAREHLRLGPSGPWDGAELAWLAERCGALDEARQLLAECTVEDYRLAQLVSERLEAG